MYIDYYPTLTACGTKLLSEKEMQVIVICKEEKPFIHTMPEYESILLIQDSKGNIRVMDVNIHFLEKEDKTVSTIITASENMIADGELKKLVAQLGYPT
ncbi:hypothetical protein ACOMXK_004329 [Enterobacter ludwigii]